jgi:hypothetical protein
MIEGQLLDEWQVTIIYVPNLPTFFLCQTPYIYEKKLMFIFTILHDGEKKMSEKNVTLVLGSN